MPTVETFIIGPDTRSCDEIRAELTEQARQKSDEAYAAGDDLHGGIWLRVSEWIEENARVRP